MSHINYDFLTESLFFSDAVKNHFSSLSEKEILNALSDYREYVLKNKTEIEKEIKENRGKVSVVIDSFSRLPNEDMLKQLALYVDYVIVADPIFEIAEPKSNATLNMSSQMGLYHDIKVDREKLFQAVSYMMNAVPFINSEYLKFVPLSFLHEVPEKIPISFDRNNFADCIPSELMHFLRQRIQVHNLINENNCWRVVTNKPLKKGTGLYITFEGFNNRDGEIVLYSRPEFTDINDTHFSFSMEIAKHISDFEFNIWLEQSKNRASQQLCNEVFSELYYAKQLNSMYLTSSPSKSDLISINIGSQSIESKIANMSLKLDLPVWNNVSLKDILSVRTKYGESFYNFRVALGQELLRIHSITSMDELQNELQNISYKFNNVFINDINVQMKSLTTHLGIDAVVLIGSLLSNFSLGNCTMVATAYAIADGASNSLSSLCDIKKNPGYFLWKLSKKYN